MGRTIVEVEGMENMSKIFGYSLKEIENMWDVGTHYKNFTDHPIDTIITDRSKKEIDKRKDVLPSVFQQLKDMVGNHYIPVPISYNTKDGKVVHTITYNKVNWREKTVYSKIQVLND